METSIPNQNDWYVDLYQNNKIIGAVIDMWRDLAFHGRHLKVFGVEDRRVMGFYEEAVAASGIEQAIPSFFLDYLLLGRLVGHQIFDVQMGYWTDTIIDDQRYVEIIFPSNYDGCWPAPTIRLHPAESQVEWAQSTDPRIAEQRSRLDPKLVAAMTKGELIQFNQADTLFLARKSHKTDFYGTSFVRHAATAPTAKVFSLLGVDVSALTDDETFSITFLAKADYVRERISKYILQDHMFSQLANMHQFLSKTDGLIYPQFAWLQKYPETHLAESKQIVVNALEKTGVCLEALFVWNHWDV
jgi:hypothetical protein